MIITCNGSDFNSQHITWIGPLYATTMDQVNWCFDIGLCDGKIFTSPHGSKEDVKLRRGIFIDYINDHRPPFNVDKWIQNEVDRKAAESAAR